jgi:hypothetical protein
MGADKRKEEIIREELVFELNQGLIYVHQRIRNLYGGLLGKWLNPIAAIFFGFFQERKFKERLFNQLDLLFKVASSPDTEFEDCVREHFEEYLKNEEIYIRANPKHPRFDYLLEILRDIYTSRVTYLSNLLRAEGETYAELVRNCYPNRRGVELLLGNQYRYLDEIMELLKNEEGLFKIPSMIRTEVMLVIKDSYRYAKEKLNERLDRIYGKECIASKRHSS